MYLPFSLSIQVFAFIITFILALAAGIAFVPVLKRLKVKQTIRDDGPATHLKKMGTPTMGGIIFLLPIMLSTVFFCRRLQRSNPYDACNNSLWIDRFFG